MTHLACFKVMLLWKKIIPLVISFGILIALAMPSVNAWSSDLTDWGACRNITIDSGKIDANLSNFPVTLVLNNTVIDYAKTQDSGQDFRVTNSPCDGNGSIVPYEIEQWDETGNSIVHFLASSIDSSTDTIYSYYYDNPSASDGQNTSAVWDSNYKAVWHLDCDGTTTCPDSTSNNIDLIKYTDANNPVEFDAKLGKGQSFDGGSPTDDILNTSTTELPDDTDDQTYEFLIYADSWNLYDRIFIRGGNGDGGGYLGVYTGGSLNFATDDDGAHSRTSSTFSTGTWYHVALVRNSGSNIIYVNGVSQSTVGGDNWGSDTTTAFVIGSSNPYRGFHGDIDEARASDIPRSAAWIKASYNSVMNSLVNYGAEELNENNTYPQITIITPLNQTYYTSSITLNFTATDAEDLNLSVAVYVDGSLNDTYEIDNATYKTINFIFTGGQHYFMVNATDDDGASTETTVYFYVFAGLNASAFDSSTGSALTDWDIYITNGTSNYTNTTLNNPTLLEWSDLPTGNVNITFSDGSDTKYYFNSTYEGNINNSDILILEGQLSEKPISTIDLDASPSWTVDENTAITVTCSASEGTPTLERDGISVSNPFNSILPFGSYNFTCYIGETENYAPASQTTFLTVQSGGFGCTNTSTYAFARTITVTSNPMTLNFASLIENGFVKDDLSDVYVDVTTTTYKNESEKSIIVNTTGYSSFTVHFGNYASNNSYTETAISGNIINITSYTEQNSYYVLTFLEETNGAQQLPPDGNITVSLICSQGTSSIDVNETKVLFATFDDQLDEIKTTVTYSSTEYYSRNRIIDAPIEYLNIYLVDANEHQVAQMLISLQDATGDFLESKFVAKKYLEGTLETITEHYFDAERKVVAYLINGDKYQVYVDNGEEQRNIGYLYIDPIDLSKTINIGEILTINQSVANITYTLEYDASTTSIVFSMNDPEGLVIGTEFWVWNESEDLVYYANSSNHTQVSYTYLVPNTSQDYKAKAKIHHPFYGENSITFFRSFTLGFTSPAWIFPFPFVGNFLFGWQTFIIVNGLIFTALLFGGRDSKGGIIFVVILGGIFAYFGWWVADAVILGLAGFLAILNKMTERRHIE